MKQRTSSKLVKATATAALSSLIVLGLAACQQTQQQSTGDLVKCYGVAKSGPNDWIGVSAGVCKKLAGSRAEAISPDEAAQVKSYTDSAQCYGVAAAGMNDCGTKTTACGGTVKTAASPDAWITLPKEICAQIKGGVVVIPKQ